MISKALFDTSRFNMNKKCIKLGKQISAAIAVNYIFLKIQWTPCRCSYYSFCVHFSKLPEQKRNNPFLIGTVQSFCRLSKDHFDFLQFKIAQVNPFLNEDFHENFNA